MNAGAAECADCEWGVVPDLMPQNSVAFGLWREAGRLWRMGFNGPVGLDWPAVFQMAEWLGVEMTYHDYHKLRALEMHTLHSIATRQED